MTQSLNGFRVTHTPADTASAPTALLIHGFLDDASVWDDVVDSLAGEIGAVRSIPVQKHHQLAGSTGGRWNAGSV